MDENSLEFILTAEELESGTWLEDLGLPACQAPEEEYKRLLAVCVGSQHVAFNCQVFDFEAEHQETQTKLVGNRKSGEVVGVGGDEGLPQDGATSIKFSDLKEKPLGHIWSILFWTEEQLKLLEKFKSGKNIVLCGDYGTGKTSLLVFAALEAAKDPNSEVFFIPVTNMLNSMDTNNHNVLDEAVKMKFEGTNVRVITIGDLGIHRGNHSGGDERHHLIREFLNTMSQKRGDIKVFIDELPLYEKDLKDIMDPRIGKNTQLAATLNLLESNTTQTWVALSTLSLLDNSEDPDKPLLPEMRTQTHSVLKTGFSSNNRLRKHFSMSTKFNLEELWLRVRNSSSIGSGTPEEISELSTAAENFQTSVIKGASSAHTVVGLRPTFVDLQGLKDDDYKLGLKEVFSNILKIKVPLRESIAILCGEGVSVQNIARIANAVQVTI